MHRPVDMETKAQSPPARMVSARHDIGLHYNTDHGVKFSADTYLDGICAHGFEGYGLELGFNVNF